MTFGFSKSSLSAFPVETSNWIDLSQKIESIFVQTLDYSCSITHFGKPAASTNVLIMKAMMIKRIIVNVTLPLQMCLLTAHAVSGW